MERKEEISVINRTKIQMRVTLVEEVEYQTYNLYANDFRVYDFQSNPSKRKFKIILDEWEE